LSGLLVALVLAVTPAEQLLKQAWRAWPHTLAAVLARGAPYLTPPHVGLISREIVSTVDAGGGLVIVEAPPRHGKSEFVSRRLPLWHMQDHPDRHVTLAGYGASLPVAHSRWVRDALGEHASELGVALAGDSTAADRWHTTRGGSCRAVGVGGALTGFGSHLLVIDDPISNAEEADSEVMREKIWDWFTAVAWTRREPGATVVVMHTRWHEDDLVGRIVAHPELGKHAKRITLRAIAEDDDPLGRKPGEALWPERYSVAALEDIRAALPARWWSALYQQRPTSAEGAEIKRHWWRWYDALPVIRERMDFVCASWDCAFRDSDGSDYVVGTVWGVFGSFRYLLDMFRERIDFAGTVKAVVDMNAKWKPNATLIEAKANGDAVINTLRDLVPGIVPVEPQGGKESRVRAATPQIQAGNVYLPKTSWANALVEEAAAFPLGKFDDAIDSTAQALNWLLYHRAEHVTHLPATDSRWVPPHVLALQQRGVLGFAPHMKGKI
jgi:predicted phage terminase large subunit-like protein